MIYYIETNLIVIIVGIALLFLEHKSSSSKTTSQLIMLYMVSLLLPFSISDIAAYCFRGVSLIGVEVSNIIYFLCMAVGSYLWFLFIHIKIGFVKNLKKFIMISSLPLVILSVGILLNPVTNYFFSVDENLLYHRGNGVILTWIVEWGYFLLALLRNIIAAITEKRNYVKREYLGYLVFVIPTAAASVCQMLFYGTTTIQVGFMLALLMAYLNQQHFMAQRDELTDLNNKNAFLRYRDSFMSITKEVSLMMIMLDIDNFKSINDTYGHIKGDNVLREVSDVLKKSVSMFSQNKLSVFRYGGDEFVFVGKDLTIDDYQLIKDSIVENLDEKNEDNHKNGEKYHLALSMGCAFSFVSDINDFDILLKHADEEMYFNKSSIKNK